MNIKYWIPTILIFLLGFTITSCNDDIMPYEYDDDDYDVIKKTENTENKNKEKKLDNGIPINYKKLKFNILKNYIKDVTKKLDSLDQKIKVSELEKDQNESEFHELYVNRKEIIEEIKKVKRNIFKSQIDSEPHQTLLRRLKKYIDLEEKKDRIFNFKKNILSNILKTINKLKKEKKMLIKTREFVVNEIIQQKV